MDPDDGSGLIVGKQRAIILLPYLFARTLENGVLSLPTASSQRINEISDRKFAVLQHEMLFSLCRYTNRYDETSCDLLHCSPFPQKVLQYACCRVKTNAEWKLNFQSTIDHLQVNFWNLKKK